MKRVLADEGTEHTRMSVSSGLAPALYGALGLVLLYRFILAGLPRPSGGT
jgi:hypothetical protein